MAIKTIKASNTVNMGVVKHIKFRNNNLSFDTSMYNEIYTVKDLKFKLIPQSCRAPHLQYQDNIKQIHHGRFVFVTLLSLNYSAIVRLEISEKE